MEGRTPSAGADKKELGWGDQNQRRQSGREMIKDRYGRVGGGGG